MFLLCGYFGGWLDVRELVRELVYELILDVSRQTGARRDGWRLQPQPFGGEVAGRFDGASVVDDE